MRYSRRHVLRFAAGAAIAGGMSRVTRAAARQAGSAPRVRTIDTPTLTIGFEESGNPQGFPVLLLHGFPDDVRAWDRVAAPLVNEGYRVIVPYLRGYGLTRIKDVRTRTGQQTALAQDLIDLLDVLGIDRFVVSGYDWGGRTANIVAALHPQRVRGAVLIGGYLIQDNVAAPQPAAPERERAFWYQWYFNTERGRIGLDKNRRSLCRLLWETWSPTWKFSDEEYNTTAASFENPDFVDVVIHSYRHRNQNAPGEPRFEDTERRLARRPPIDVPSIVLYGSDDAVAAPPAATSTADKTNFRGLIDRRAVSGAGHFMPREKPEVVSSALLQVLKSTK